MICPYCESKNVKTKDTRTYYDPKGGFHYVERKRACNGCQAPFKTIEVTHDAWLLMTEGEEDEG